MDNLKEFLYDLLEQTEENMQAAIVADWPAGKKSNLYKSLVFKPKQSGNKTLVDYTMNDYYKYVGAKVQRKPRAKKIPIKVILNMIKKYGIRPKSGQTINQVAFAIQQSIYKNGIKGKGFTDRMIKVGEETLLSTEVDDKLFEEIFQNIKKNLTKK